MARAGLELVTFFVSMTFIQLMDADTDFDGGDVAVEFGFSEFIAGIFFYEGFIDMICSVASIVHPQPHFSFLLTNWCHFCIFGVKILQVIVYYSMVCVDREVLTC